MRNASAMTDERLSAVILAAGGSTRLGRPKQLLRFRGSPLILNAVRLAHHVAGDRVIVVLGDRQLRLRGLLRRHRERVTVINNANWRDGLASSLRSGLKAVAPTTAAALILLVDQARLGPADIGRLVVCWRQRPARPAAARYDGHAGAPAVIPRRWFREVLSIDGDVGARHVLRRLGEVSLVDMPAAAFDVDTADDAAALRG